MNVNYVLLLYLIGLVSLWNELKNRKHLLLITIVFFIVFVMSVFSRINNYPSYADLGAYLYRFQNSIDSYFGFGYRILTKAVRYFFSNNKYALMFIISTINFTSVYLAAKYFKEGSSDGIEESSIRQNKSKFIGTFLFLYSMYWGLSFTSEVIRTGIAISISILAIALVNSHKKLAFLFFSVSVLFHWTQIFLAPFLYILYREEKYKVIPLYIFVLWFFFIVTGDFVNVSALIVNILIVPLKWLLEVFNLSSHYSIYLVTFERISLFSYVSRQYLFYMFLAIVFLFGDMNNRKYNIFVFGYFLGLTIFTLLNSLLAITRMQWIYLVLSIYVIYLFASLNNKFSFTIKGILVSGIVLLQTIMAILYLK